MTDNAIEWIYVLAFAITPNIAIIAIALLQCKYKKRSHPSPEQIIGRVRMNQNKCPKCGSESIQ